MKQQSLLSSTTMKPVMNLSLTQKLPGNKKDESPMLSPKKRAGTVTKKKKKDGDKPENPMMIAFRKAIIKKLKLYGLYKKKKPEEEVEPVDYSGLRSGLANTFNFETIRCMIDRLEEKPN